MRLSLSVKFSLLCVLLVVLVAGVTSYLMVFRFGASGEQELVSRDRELARVLINLRTSEGKPDFETLQSFVGTSDRVDTGLVYALELDRGGQLLEGALNPRLFAGLGPEFARSMQQGRKRVLELLAAGKVDRQGLIKEYSDRTSTGQIRLGFNLQRIEQQIAAQQKVALGILGAGLLLGILCAVVLARQLTRPVKRLAGAMQAVARGDVDQTVQVTSSDELASLAASFNQMTRALREQARVRGLFGLYMDAAVVERILREANPLEMVPEDRAVTVVSIAFHNFSVIQRQLSPRETIGLINDYLAPIIDAVHDCSGLVDRMEGHRLVAIWGAPGDVPDPELSAIRAALAARAAAEDEGRRQLAAGGLALQLCIGICAGRAVAGNIGSAKRVVYRVLGGPVELARHVERMAAPGQILVSEGAYAKVRKQVAASVCAPLILEDLEEAIPLYRVESITG